MLKKRILLIDNDSDTVMMTKSRLEANDYVVMTTGNGWEGVELAKEYQPDVILLDVIMPVMEGCEVCMKLKEEARTREIPILMFTVSAKENLETACLKAGAKAVISKPFDPNKLLTLIKKALDPNSKWRRAENARE